jgi:hypothetical protein
MIKLFAAMAKAFPEIEGATKDNENAAFKNGGRVSKYADLSSVSDAIKPALSRHGLFYVQMTHEQTGGVCIETIVGHESGEQFSFGKLFVPASKQDAQGYGSALTYARRYSLMTAFGVCPEDDDGNAAVRTPPQREAPSSRITEDQRATLLTLAQQGGADMKGFCRFFKIDSMPELPAEHYAKAKAMLEKKLAEKQAAPVAEAA